MTEISTAVPEITTATVDEPLISPPPATVPPPYAGRDRASTRVPVLLGFFYSRRGASLVVRENVAMQIEDWREDWGYSLPVVVLDALWNLAFVVVSLATVFWFAPEEKNLELRSWICGYAVLCVFHVVVMLLEYRRRNRRGSTSQISLEPIGAQRRMSRRRSRYVDDESRDLEISCETIKTTMYYIWWIVGVIWTATSYDKHGSSRLLWLTLAFLSMDVFFCTISSIGTCFLVVAYCFCFPCIITFMYYLRLQEHASEADINNLPIYICEIVNDDVEQPDVRTCRMIPIGTNSPDFSTERVLTTETECSICLNHYEQGDQLRSLRCNHHFHSECIAKWLRVRANCPICKSLVTSNEQG